MSKELHDARIKCYELFRNQLQHEDFLSSQRVTWIVASQAFLLGSYVFLVNQPFFYIIESGSFSLGFQGATFDAQRFYSAVFYVKWVFGLLGILSCIAAFVGMLSAQVAIMKLVKNYKQTLIPLEYDAKNKIFKSNSANIGQKTPKEIDDEMVRIHQEAGLPSLVTPNNIQRGGFIATAFFGPAFAIAWLALLLQPGTIRFDLSIPWIAIIIAIAVTSFVYLILRVVAK